MYKRFTVTALSCAALLLSGCAGFKGNQLSPVSAQDLRSTAPVKTKVFSRWNLSSVPGGNAQTAAALAAINKTNFENALKASDCCIVVESPEAADLVVDGIAHTEDKTAALIPAVITGLSLFTIPSWITANVHISATAKNGGVSRSYDLQDHMTMVQWLPMLLVLPFADNPFKAEKEITENVFNTLVVKIKSDGLVK
ncbi:MAG: hypothetical protein EPO09_12365 [Aquabacterium sp.]|uniref:hypothetical protein n=1 Tax=Aquabacterium sp. TaxID=1872578 RepID=UPI00122C024C|nr:hypothetical protein [Aquabacterium sp.]TAK93516.1 MAG: hypothetical protein EPO09_12365 [Aquabacterium sp.]